MSPIETIRARRDEERGMLEKIEAYIAVLRDDLATSENRRLVHVAKIEAYDDILAAYASPEAAGATAPRLRKPRGTVMKFVVDEIAQAGAVSADGILRASAMAGHKAHSVTAVLRRLRDAGKITLVDDHYRIADAGKDAAE